jgi:integrase
MHETDNDYLTDLSAMSYLVQEDRKMKSVIRPISRQTRCPKCLNKFKHFPKLGYICPECKTIPTRFYIDIHWNGKRPRICSDKTGQALDTYERAFNLLSQIRGEISNHTFDPTKYVAGDIKKFLADYLLDKFLEEKSQSIAPSYTGYKKYVERHKSFFKNIDVREIRKHNLKEYLRWLKTQKKSNGKNLRSKSIENIYDNFLTFMRWLEDEDIVKPLPKFPSEEEVEEIMDSIVANEEPFKYTWYMPDDQLNMLNVLEDEKDREFVMFLFLHPCRPGEARALKVSQIDHKTMTLNIDASFSRNVRRQRRKGKKSKPYNLPINPEMADFFKEKFRSNLLNKDAFVFLNPRTGEFYSQSSIDRIFDRIRKALNIPKNVRFYDATRHSGISQLLNFGGTSLFHASKLAGHSSIKMTEGIYGHEHPESLRTEIAKLSLNSKAKIVELDKLKKSDENKLPSTNRQQDMM